MNNCKICDRNHDCADFIHGHQKRIDSCNYRMHKQTMYEKLMKEMTVDKMAMDRIKCPEPFLWETTNNAFGSQAKALQDEINWLNSEAEQ